MFIISNGRPSPNVDIYVPSNAPRGKQFVKLVKTVNVMDPISNFFLWCAGVSTRVIYPIDIDHNKYVALGILVFLTGVLASLAGGVAVYFVVSDRQLAIAFGIFWGFVVFSIDRFIIMTVKKQGDPMREFFQILPRIVLSVLISLIISKPLEMIIFEKEISAKISEQSNIKANAHLLILNEQFGIEEATKALAEVEAIIESRNQEFIDEFKGRSGGDKGVGPQAREIKEMIAALLRDKKVTEDHLYELQSKVDYELEKFKNNYESGGILRKLEALEFIADDSTQMAWAIWFITAFFIVLETGPVISKLLMARSAYDGNLDAEEASFQDKAQIELQFYKKLWQTVNIVREDEMKDIVSKWKTTKEGSVKQLFERLKAQLTDFRMGGRQSTDQPENKSKKSNWLVEHLRSWLIGGALSLIVVGTSYLITGSWDKSGLNGVGFFLVSLLIKNEKSNSNLP